MARILLAFSGRGHNVAQKGIKHQQRPYRRAVIPCARFVLFNQLADGGDIEQARLGHVAAQRLLQSQRERIAAIMTADAVAALLFLCSLSK